MSSLLRLSLPYHDSNSFVRLLQILQIPQNDPMWCWLIPMQGNSVPIPRQTILNRCLADVGFLGWICESVDRSLEVAPIQISKNLGGHLFFVDYLTFAANRREGKEQSRRFIADFLCFGCGWFHRFSEKGFRGFHWSFDAPFSNWSQVICFAVNL